MTETATASRRAIRLDAAVSPFAPYPDAVWARGLVFTSGVRPGAAGPGFGALPASGRKKEQGYGLADRDEGRLAQSAFGAHGSLEAVLNAAGSDNAQILRQHVWQKDKRFFPVYENVRIGWQPSPAPSSGLGVCGMPGTPDAWIGLDAIAVAPGTDPLFPPRAVIADVNQKALPSASHYAQAVRSGPLVFTAGHIAIKTQEPGKPVVQGFDDLPEEGKALATGRSHPDSRDGPIAAQAWYIYDQLKALLARGGFVFENVVLSTVYLADPRDFAVFHRVHRLFFPEHEPALCVSTFDEVGHRGCRIEIELTVLDPAAGLDMSAVDWTIPKPLAAPAGRWAGPFLFLSGVPGLDTEGRLVEPTGDRAADVTAQSEAALARLGEVLGSVGLDFASLAKLTLYAEEEGDLALFEAARRAVMPDDGTLPAFECVLIPSGGPIAGAYIQIDAIAVR